LVSLPATIVVLSLLTLTLACFTEHFNSHVLELDNQLLRIQLVRRSRTSDVFQHFFSTIAKARSFDCAARKYFAEVVDYQGSKSFAFDIFCDEHEWTASASYFFEYWH
jgi:hypothetical protein